MASDKKTKSVGATILAVLVAIVVILLRDGEGERARDGLDSRGSGESAGAERAPELRGADSGAVAVADQEEVGELVILGLFKEERSDTQVDIRARVSRVLSDDNEGDRHQRFILEFRGSGHSVLISHNIDLAERVPIKEGDSVRVVGEYEWSDRGGVIHWTHHNPARHPIHPPGWVEHGGVRYE